VLCLSRRSQLKANRENIRLENLTNFFDEKARRPQSGTTISLAQLFQNLPDLLAKKFGTAGRWMANAVRVETKLLKLRGGDFSERNDLLARK
jgi:hypothetical protein